MAKIFLSFMNCMRCGNDTSAMPCYYESFLKGLKNAGNEILVFSDWGIPYGDRPSSTARIKKSITAFQPDLIIAFNNYGPDFSSMCDCPIVILEVDSPLYYDGKALIKRHPDRYLYCVVQEESRRVLMSDFGVPDSRISFLPFFSEVRAERKEKVYNISFLGSRFAGREFHWHHFRRKHNDMRDIEEYKRLIDEIRAHPLAPAAEVISRSVGLNLTEADVANLILSLSAEKRVGVLSCVADLGLALWGTDDWLKSGAECADLYLAYHPEKIFSLQQNQDLYNASKICINVNHLQAVSAFSWRVCDIMASTGCLLSEYRPNLDRLFPEIPIPTFTNKYEAREQCKRLLADEGRREEISELCRQAIDQRYRFSNVLSTLEQVTGMTLRTTSREGSVAFVSYANYPARRGHRLSCALQCLKLAITQIPGCERLFTQKNCVKRIVKYTDYW